MEAVSYNIGAAVDIFGYYLTLEPRFFMSVEGAVILSSLSASSRGNTYCC